VGYTAVRASRAAIEAAERLASESVETASDPIGVEQIDEQLGLAIDKVAAEGGVVDRELAALALRQAEGDAIEASFILRAYRSTLPRLGYSATVSSDEMTTLRRISSVFKDIPGGQYLGATRDYAQRLLELAPRDRSSEGWDALTPTHPQAGTRQRERESEAPSSLPRVVDHLREEGLMAPAPAGRSAEEPFDVTRQPLRFPVPRSGRLQSLARGEAGGMLLLAYSSMRGWGGTGHGAIAELRGGELPVRIHHPVTGRLATIGRVPVTEVQYVTGGKGSLQDGETSEYEFGYGLVPGRDERKAISMAIIDASLRLAKPDATRPVESQEFVLSHVDGIESSGFVEHLKLPHYVTFQAGLQRARRFRKLLEEARRA
jgi:alpha-D-ribose 1-methylphosphonate 5-triphosphate synthase subunit PhnI